MKKGAIIVAVVAVIAVIAGFIYFNSIESAITITAVSVAGVILGMLDSDTKTKPVHWVQALVHAALVIALLNFIYKYTAIIVPFKESIIVYTITAVLTNVIIAVQKSDWKLVLVCSPPVKEVLFLWKN